VRLEPLNAASHGDDLFEIATVSDAADRFRYLSEEPPESRAAFETWLEAVQASEDPLYFSVIDKALGKAAGRQTFTRIEPAHGRIEIGHIHWGPTIARKPAATEAHYLFMRHAFEDSATAAGNGNATIATSRRSVQPSGLASNPRAFFVST